VEWVTDIFSRVTGGSAVRFPENNVTKCGNVISAAPVREDAAGSAEKAVRSILIRLEPGGTAAADFLAVFPSGETRFPPDAFTPDKRLLGLLEQLPDPVWDGRAEVSILAFPEFAVSGLTDYAGRGVEESLEAVRVLTGRSLPLHPPAALSGPGPESAPDNRGGRLLGRRFWAALIRGGYQGAAWLIDTLGNP
jgi:hypothetical protein